eukprot:m.173605 g.173605  ORF g.173605 m.173605 type:complete len:135 (-) comp14586_c3_seq19:924-1328(-)
MASCPYYTSCFFFIIQDPAVTPKVSKTEELDVAQLLEPEMLEISEQLTLLRGRKRRLERLCYKNPHKYLVDLLKDAFTYREAIKTCDEDKAAMLTCYLNAMGKEIQLAKDYMIDVYIHAERVARSQLHFLSEGE